MHNFCTLLCGVLKIPDYDGPKPLWKKMSRIRKKYFSECGFAKFASGWANVRPKSFNTRESGGRWFLSLRGHLELWVGSKHARRRLCDVYSLFTPRSRRLALCRPTRAPLVDCVRPGFIDRNSARRRCLTESCLLGERALSRRSRGRRLPTHNRTERLVSGSCCRLGIRCAPVREDIAPAGHSSKWWKRIFIAPLLM